MARGSSGRGSSGAAYVVRTGSSSGSTVGNGANKSSSEELIMSLSLKERCHLMSIEYANSVLDYHYIFQAWCEKMMVGCPDEYFDVDSIAALYLTKRREGPSRSSKSSVEESIMRLPLSERCNKMSFQYAKCVRESNSVFEVWCKKMMVGCPEKYFNVEEKH